MSRPPPARSLVKTILPPGAADADATVAASNAAASAAPTIQLFILAPLPRATPTAMKALREAMFNGRPLHEERLVARASRAARRTRRSGSGVRTRLVDRTMLAAVSGSVRHA